MITIARVRSRVASVFTAVLCLHEYNANASSTLAHLADASPSSTASGGSNNNLHRNLNSPLYEEFYNNEVETWLNKKRAEIERTVFISYDSQGIAYPSTAYVYDDFLQTLRSMSVNGVGGGDEQVFFYIGQTDGKGIIHGLVNAAAFLAHAMAISIRYDVCDEFNIDATDFSKKYAVSNSCGQWGRTYQDEVCVGDEASMTCDVNPDMAMTAADSLDRDMAPPPLECRARESESDFTGHWDAELGKLSEIYPYANRVGVMHNEGCCWWGRGILFTRGPCNFGRLDHYLGRKATEQGFLNSYDVDICAYPEIVCEGEDTRGLRWSVGYFEWADRVQTYQNTAEGLDYMKDLDMFVETGFIDVNRFIDVVGKALPFGCIEENCLAAEEKVKQERRDNFLNLVFNVLNLPFLIETTPYPTPPPTNKPTTDATPPLTMRPATSNPPPTRMPTQQPTARLTPAPTQPVITPTPTSQPLVWTTPKPTPQPFNPPTPQPFNPLPTQPSEPTPQPQDTFTNNVCSGQSSAYIAFNKCRDYVQCVNGNNVLQQTCSAGLLFDSAIGACNWESEVTCTAPTQRPTPRPTQQTEEMPQPTGNTAPKPTPQPQDTFTSNVCSGQSSAFIPIDECREFVQCFEEEIVNQRICADGLLFDSSIKGCNWESMVTCTAPTQKPTSRPTQQFTPRPTQQPSQQTPKPTRQPSPQAPPPTNSPSIKSVPFPISTQPPFVDQRPIGPPSDNYDGQKEQSYEPTHLLQPSHEGFGLINLPSRASKAIGGDIVWSSGFLWMFVLGAFMIL